MPGKTFLTAFLSSVLLVFLILKIERNTGILEQPRQDRWHTKPTPHLGGVGIFIGFLIAVFSFTDFRSLPLGILLGAGIAFLLGLIDDLRDISPPTKLLGLFIAAFSVIVFGNITAFFPWRFANILISFLWLVGIANALNLLDNMDGLAAGTTIITTGFLAYFFWQADNLIFLQLSLAVGGSVLGFWIFNFPPASIFMGDSGSLFLGLILSALAIAREPQASNVFAVFGIPLFIFLLPIMDTVMVSLTRILRGQSPVQGGRDHTSHRLVALGLSERQTLFLMMAVAIISGAAAVILESWSYYLSLALLPFVVLVLAVLTAYLGKLKVVDIPESVRGQQNVLVNWMVDLTYRRRVLEVLLDFFIITFSYYVANLVVVGFPMVSEQTYWFLQTIPIVVVCTYGSFFIYGIYHGVWEYLSIEDALRYLRASLSGTGLTALFVYLIFGGEHFAVGVFLLYVILLLLLIFGTRFSFRLLDNFIMSPPESKRIPILIYGAGDAGELALRECLQNPSIHYDPIGFLDDDPLKKGRRIHGVKVLGDLSMLKNIIKREEVEGLIITSSAITQSGAEEKAVEICKSEDVWVKRLQLDFILIEG